MNLGHLLVPTVGTVNRDADGGPPRLVRVDRTCMVLWSRGISIDEEEIQIHKPSEYARLRYTDPGGRDCVCIYNNAVRTEIINKVSNLHAH